MVMPMLRKALNILISILLLLPLFTGVGGSLHFSIYETASFQEPCPMDQCYPYMPKCPLCPSASSNNLILNQEALTYLPPLNSSYIQIISKILTDQGVIKSIFHPP